MKSSTEFNGFREGDMVRHHWDHIDNRWRKQGIVIRLNLVTGWAVVEWMDGDVGSSHVDDLDKLTPLDRLADI